MRAICTGDWHLGAGAALGRQPGDRLQDQADVADKIADLAVEHAVDVVLIAGDVLEGPTVLPEQLDVFARFIARCHHAAIPIVACTGNGKHDLAMRDTNGLEIFKHIPGIRISSAPEIIDVDGVSVAMLPWVHPGRLVAAQNDETDRDEVNSVVAGLLLETARGLRAQISEDRPAILLAHWSIDCASLPNGMPVADLREPVLSWDSLSGLGYDAIIAAHIHAPQFLGDGSEDGSTGVYTGSPMPLSFGEEQTEHGVFLLELAA